MGFCRTNLYKRLESSGQAFKQSIERHILRNYVYLYAIEHDLRLPIGTQDAGLLNTGINDEDMEEIGMVDAFGGGEEEEEQLPAENLASLRNEEEFKRRAAEVYSQYAGGYTRRFRWLRHDLFVGTLTKDLLSDARSLTKVLERCTEWHTNADAKLNALAELLMTVHPQEKVIVFTQFADTVRYLETQLKSRGISKLAGVTGTSDDPTELAWRFSPISNSKRDQVGSDEELRVLVATDVLSEGQNLQDSFVVVNYDLPWAIVRLVQRIGRVDRIGQEAPRILCYSFLPARA